MRYKTYSVTVERQYQAFRCWRHDRFSIYQGTVIWTPLLSITCYSGPLDQEISRFILHRESLFAIKIDAITIFNQELYTQLQRVGIHLKGTTSHHVYV